MDYQIVYNKLIERARSENRVKGLGIYYEAHHIKPECLGGKNESTNIVRLTAREHFVCHWLLHRAYPQNRKLAIAFDRMAKGGSKKQLRYIPSSRTIAEAREASSRARVGIKRPSVSAKLKGRIVTPDTVAKRLESRERNNTSQRMRERMTGSGNPMYGLKREDRALLNTKTKSRKCVIDGMVYESAAAASEILGMPHKTLLNRIRSVNFANYVWFLS